MSPALLAGVGQPPQRHVAQWFERLSYKQQREGSIPSMPTGKEGFKISQLKNANNKLLHP